MTVVSDGLSACTQLDDHRHLLVLAFLTAYPAYAYRTRRDTAGVMHAKWFMVGVTLRGIGQINYVLPLRLWELADFLPEVPQARKGDGYVSEEILPRLEAFIRRQ